VSEETLHLRLAAAAVAISIGLFLSILLCIELGRRFGVRQAARLGPEERSGAIVGDTVVYALLSLLIGFTFNGAASRFDVRRELVIQEVGAASTAWQRIGSLPPEAQTTVRADFRRYVDAVIAPYDDNPATKSAALMTPVAITSAQDSVWTHALAACLIPTGERARMLLLPSLNEMFDAVDRAHLLRRIHPPIAIFVMLGFAILAGALFVGYGMAAAPRRNWLHILGVAATISAATYVIIELEYPRLGAITADSMDRALVEFRATMQ